MGWKVFLTAAGAMLPAELGDKTPTATVPFAGDEAIDERGAFAGASLALVATFAPGTLAAATRRSTSPRATCITWRSWI